MWNPFLAVDIGKPFFWHNQNYKKNENFLFNYYPNQTENNLT